MSVTFVNGNTPVRQVGGSFSSTFNISATSANHVALAHLAYDQTAGLTVSAITLGGVAMTSCGAAKQSAADGGGNFTFVESFYLLNPTSGAAVTLAVTVTGANEIYANVVVAVGSFPPTITNYTSAGGGAASTSLGVTVTSSASELTMSAASVAGGAVLTGTTQTSDGIEASGSYTMGSDHCTTPGASITHTWTADSLGEFAVIGFSIADAVQTPYLTRSSFNVGSTTRPKPFTPGIAR